MLAEIIQAILTPSLEPLGEYLVNPIKNQVSYLCCYSCNVERLNHEVPELNARIESVKRDVKRAEDNLEVIRPDVEFWLTKVEEVQRKSTGIRDEAAEVQRRSCLFRWCPPLHYSLSKKAKKTTKDAIELRNTRFERISDPVNPADVPPIPSRSANEFGSRDPIENKIIDALKDDSVYLIGICGMGGVGKTTMAKKIRERVREKTEGSGSMFEHVVMVVLSQQPDLPKIQQEIADGLGFNLESKSPDIRARLLHAKLRTAKRVLIILDDIWEWLNLEEELGIPSHAGCKLILTSRHQDALRDAKIFRLEVLTDKESWTLFRENVGDAVDSPDLHQVAKDVVKECKGLPLALVTVGRALRGRRKSSWEDALVGLQKSIPRNIPNVLKNVYRPLLLSFNQLESEEYRYLFLLCCLFPEDSTIPLVELVRYGVGLGMFEGIENLRQAGNRVKSIVENLIFRSLLTESIESSDWQGGPCVKMHDVIRDVGIWIASEGKHGNHVFMISHGKNEWPMPKEDSYGNYTCISLTFSRKKIVAPECINCPRLELLRMDKDYGNFGIPENFFSGMRGLKVLEASRTKSLPSSIHLLSNLRTLHLFKCELGTPSMIGELINLEILSLWGCTIEVLPEETGGLKKLRKLDITICNGPTRIAFGVISGLVRLEELVMIDSFKNWEAEEKDNEVTNASLAELDSLSYLTTLQIEIRDPNVIPKTMPHWVQKVMKYSISVSRDRSLIDDDFKFHKVIWLGNEVVTPLGDWIYGMARDAEFLNLGGPNCKNVVDRLVRSGYQNLQYLRLSMCTNVQYLSNAFAEGQQNGAIFPSLKHLSIGDSCSLQEISNGPPLVGSFEALEEIKLEKLPEFMHLWTFSSEKLYLSNLKIVQMNNCASMLYLFPLSIAGSFSKLEELEVSNCPAMEEIFKKEEVGMEITINKLEFPKLESLCLKNLQGLCGFCKGVDQIEVPTLSDLTIGNLPSIMGEGDHDICQQFLFHQQVAGNSLEFRLMLTPLANFNISTRLQELTVEGIHNFKSLFSPSILSGFSNLKGLNVENCSKLEEVIGKEENVGEAKSKTTLFPQLQLLVLQNLPKILTFSHSMGDVLELPSLEGLSIGDCPVMETFVRELSNVPILRSGIGTSYSEHVHESFFSKEIFFPKLESLHLKRLNMVGIFSHNTLIDDFCGLEKLTVESCHRMTNLFSPPIFRGLINLRQLELIDCEELEEMIAEEDEEGPTNIKETLSPQLKYLKLIRLPVMRRFCHMNNDLEFPSLKSVTILGCPMLERFSLGPLHLPRLNRIEGLLDHDFAAKFFFNKEKSSDEIHPENNCFTLSARDLSINYVKLFDDEEWFLAPDSSDSFVAAAKLPIVGSVEITGKFETRKLPAGVAYEIIFMIMLDAEDEWEGFARGWEEPVDLKLTLPGGITQHRTEILDEKPKGKWIEILVGEFTREPHQIGHLEFSLYKLDKRLKEGLYTKGVRIRMKG